MAGLFVSGDTKVRAKIAAQVTAATEIVPKAPARLQDSRLFIETRFDLVKIFGMLFFTPAPDFQFTWFSHFLFPDQEFYRGGRSTRREKENKISAFLAFSAVNHFSFVSRYRSTAWAAFLPLAMASTTVLGPLTKSPAANTPSALACRVS